MATAPPMCLIFAVKWMAGYSATSGEPTTPARRQLGSTVLLTGHGGFRAPLPPTGLSKPHMR